MRSKLFYISLILGAAFIFYLSWLPSPIIGSKAFLPSKIADWTDAEQNDTIRTGVPFLLLGLLSGIYLTFKKAKFLLWLGHFILLISIVLLAELGQMALPFRTSDWRDITWGILGAFLGMTSIWLSYNFTNVISCIKSRIL